MREELGQHGEARRGLSNSGSAALRATHAEVDLARLEAGDVDWVHCVEVANG